MVDANTQLNTADYNSIRLSPPIITVMIDMFLAGGSNKKSENEEKYYYLFNGQQTVSIIFLLVAFASVPLMLLVKPLVLKRRMAAHHGNHVDVQQEYVQYEASKDGKSLIKNETYEEIQATIKREGSSGEHHSFADIFIHQLIETIEFVLGTVSNTASYLRLWALSLAHSQLAGVFLEQVLKIAFEMHGTVGSSIGVSYSKYNSNLVLYSVLPFLLLHIWSAHVHGHP